MDAIHSNKVLISTALAVFGLYALFRPGTTASRLIDSPDAVGSRVDHGGRDDREKEHEYDVVIIGGGTAGCVLAARISENPSVRVLLLEAGRSSRDLKFSQIPCGYSKLFGTDADYKLFTEPQSHAGDEKKYWPRGRMLGGCSSINAMMFHTCAPTDYDEWALSGQKGASAWAYKEFHKYFLKFETFFPSSTYPEVNSSLRGVNGPVKTGFFGYFHTLCAKWVEAYRGLGVPLTPDFNTPAGTMGVAKIMTYIDSNGRRSSTESGYLTQDVLKRPNLKVAVNAHVTRILFETHAGTKQAVGVEFARNTEGPRYCVRARREVVLSAGAVHSPHILMLSGVGPKKQLVEHNIPVVHDLPGVGKKLQDHIGVTMRFRTKKGLSMMYLREPKGLQVLSAYFAFLRWKILGSGPMTSNLAEAAAFIRTDDPKLFPPDSYTIEDETSGPNAPDLEVLVVPIGHGFPPTPPGDIASMTAILLRPQSAGTLTLKSADPFEAPAIDPKYLSSKNDVFALVRGVRHMTRVAQTEPFASSLIHDDSNNYALDHNLHRLTDNELELEVRKRIQTLFHPCSTCRMARLEDGGVVDPYLRVYGIENLRVADASIFPRIPSGHTAAPSIAVGEKAADIIKESLRHPTKGGRLI